MANTYVKINSVTVGSSGSNEISFNNIPQTYSDLKIIVSSRRTAANVWGTYLLKFNSDSTNSYTWREIKGDGATASATENIFTNSIKVGEGVGSGSGINIFDNTEIDIPQYCSNVNYKQTNVLSSGENNATTAYQGVWVGRWHSYSPITSISLISGSENFSQYSTFTLYGVFNADVSSAPATPTIGTATAGVQQASVTFTGVSNAASYTMTSTPGSIAATGTTSPIVVTGLTADTSYTFKVKSNNPFGSSAESAASNSITALGTAFDSIATVTVGAGGSSTVVFNSIPSTYKHLQIRYIARNSTASTDTSGIGLRMNGDTSSNYAWHSAKGNGTNLLTEAYANNADIGDVGFTIGNTATYFAGAGIVDIVDYANTNKFKTIRTVGGVSYANSNTGPNIAVMSSGLWRNTNAITSLTFNTNGNFQQYSTFALYGVKG